MPETPNKINPDWTADQTVDAWARSRGFGDPIVMTDRNLRATAREYGGCPVGLYLWEGEKHEVYIG
ncbi:MAG: hypothetical protein LBE07_00405, partial [Gordonia sp. (in: high G+C Gram-positive bacteria)]|nr:hypothetical protein [Gordonia sp. (in: high G+C Gram-positive bacteria)]